MLNRIKNHRKIRKTVIGTATRPRLAIYRSLNNIFVQLIDDSTQKTLASSSSLGKKGSLTKKAQIVGEEIASKAKELKIKTATFDRAGFRYAGAVKLTAEAAREGGLEI